MKKLVLALVMFTTNAHAVIDVPDYADETGFYDHVHCSGETLYQICPDKFTIEYVIVPSKPIHLPRTDVKAKKMPLTPDIDLKHNYRVQ
jgi:hypothetical protein